MIYVLCSMNKSIVHISTTRYNTLMNKILFLIGISVVIIIGTIVAGLQYQQRYVLPSAHLTASIYEYDTLSENSAANLTQEQKIGQLFIIGFDGTESNSFESFIKNRPVGGVLLLEKNIKNKQQVKTLTANLQALSQKYTNKNLLIAIDQEGGAVSRISFIEQPHTAQSEISGEQQAFKIAKTRGDNLYALGINLNFSPVLDVTQDQESFIWGRAFHGDTKTIGLLGAAFVKGYANANIISCPKHFPGHGESAIDPHTAPSINTQPLQKIIQQSQPFAEAISAGARCIMVGHQIEKTADLVPASQSPTILQNWLRDAFHFTGIIITDDMEMEAAHTKKQSIAEASIAALQAGADMIIISGYTTTQEEHEIIYDTVVTAIKNGALTQEQLDKKISHILSVKNSIKQN